MSLEPSLRCVRSCDLLLPSTPAPLSPDLGPGALHPGTGSLSVGHLGSAGSRPAAWVDGEEGNLSFRSRGRLLAAAPPRPRDLWPRPWTEKQGKAPEQMGSACLRLSAGPSGVEWENRDPGASSVCVGERGRTGWDQISPGRGWGAALCSAPRVRPHVLGAPAGGIPPCAVSRAPARRDTERVAGGDQCGRRGTGRKRAVSLRLCGGYTYFSLL